MGVPNDPFWTDLGVKSGSDLDPLLGLNLPVRGVKWGPDLTQNWSQMGQISGPMAEITYLTLLAEPE